MKKLGIMIWALVTIGLTYSMDHWIHQWQGSPLEISPPNTLLYYLLGILGTGSALLLFRYSTTTHAKDLITGTVLTLSGLLIVGFPLLRFYIRALQTLDLFITPRSHSWQIGVMVAITGVYLLFLSLKNRKDPTQSPTR